MKYLLIAMFMCLAGCGMTIDSTRMVNGRVVARTTGGVGYRAIDLKTEVSTPLKEECLAKVGNIPDADEVCNWEVARQLEREDRQLDWQSQPYGYSSYGYGSYGR
jgi:hypothetical protein